VAVDLQETMVLRRYAAYPLPALTDKHTSATINHIGLHLVRIHQTAPLQAK